MTIRPELKRQIETRIKEFLSSTDPDNFDLRRIAAQLQVLPILLDMGDCYALRSEGEVISFAWDDEKDHRAEQDRRIRNIALYQGSAKYPELKELISNKGLDDIDCPHCNGTGTLPINAELGVKNILCYCGGIGWIPRE